MTFREILPQFLEGKEITKKDWEAGHFIHLDKELKCIKNQEGYAVDLDGKDLIENIWEIWTNRQYFDFNKAFKLMEDGKKVARRRWEDFYIWIEGGMFMYNIDNDCDFYKIKSEDCRAIDWYLVEEENNNE